MRPFETPDLSPERTIPSNAPKVVMSPKPLPTRKSGICSKSDRKEKNMKS